MFQQKNKYELKIESQNLVIFKIFQAIYIPINIKI